MSVYVVALIHMQDREVYRTYEAGFMEIFSKYQGTMLAVDEAPIILEGEWPFTRTVLIEFPSHQAQQDWYRSDEYQALMQHRTAASVASIAVLSALPAS